MKILIKVFTAITVISFVICCCGCGANNASNSNATTQSTEKTMPTQSDKKETTTPLVTESITMSATSVATIEPTEPTIIPTTPQPTEEKQETTSEPKENTVETVNLSNTYITRFEEVNALTYPPFLFDYSDNWTISKEEVDPYSECVVLSNNSGIEIVFKYNCSKYSDSGDLQRVDISKIADSSFVPTLVQAHDYSGLGDFMVAELKTEGDTDNKVAYAVLPQSEVGTIDVAGQSVDTSFYFWYSGCVSFTCDVPNGEITPTEKNEVISILSSFRAKY